MPDVQTASPTHATRALTARSAGRWMVTFTGFPIGGYASYLITGRVDGLVPALLGGLITGAALGAVQAWGFGRNRPPVAAWIVATAVGMMIGLGLGSALVDYDTTLSALVTQGAVTGLVVGLAQAVVLLPRLGRLALAWPALLTAAWAAGWAITTAAGIDVDKQFTVFGSSGAITVAALTLVLPFVLNRKEIQS
jgi:hypothetical protein